MRDQTEKTNFIEIAGKEFPVIRYGVQQAQQVSALSKWLSHHGAGIFATLQSIQAGSQEKSSIDVIFDLLGAVTSEALIDLFDVVFLCGKPFAEKNFDIMVMVDAGIILWNESPVLRRIIDRFFSGTPSNAGSDTASTPSE